jgi:hypothetical protein
MSHKQSIQVLAVDSEKKLTPQQKKFNTLIRQIEQAKKVLASWQNNIHLYRQAYEKSIPPLLEEMKTALRAWIFALDDVYERRGWTITERELIAELICRGSADLLNSGLEDEELKQLFGKYNEVDFDSDKKLALQETKEMLEAMSGLDLGDVDEGMSAEDLLNRAQEQLHKNMEQAEAKRMEQAEKKRKTAAQKKREAEQQQATQSVRDIYRKLASALHPDREPDETQRRVKTELMQKVNQAYAANDLLVLMEIQLQIEQIDLTHIASASAEKMKHYNKVLAEQLQQYRFCAFYILPIIFVKISISDRLHAIFEKYWRGVYFVAIRPQPLPAISNSFKRACQSGIQSTMLSAGIGLAMK